jgi:hypothetical protein
VGGREEVCTEFWWKNLRERDHWGWEDNIKMDVEEVGCEVWS